MADNTAHFTDARCIGCNRTFPSVEALLNQHWEEANSLSREFGAGVPVTFFRAVGSEHFIPYMGPQRKQPLQDHIDDPSGMTMDLLSRVNNNMNLSAGSVPKPNSPERAIDMDLDLKL